MNWPIKRGQEVASGSSGYEYTMKFDRKDKGPCIQEARFYRSALVDPPTRLIEYEDSKPGDWVAEGVQLKGCITLKAPVNIEDLPKKPNKKGKLFPTFEWDWKLNVSGSSIEMIATDLDGVQVGNLDIGDAL